MDQVLSSVVLGSSDGRLGYWVWYPYYGYVFLPLGEQILDQEAKREIFHTPAAVSGEILGFWVEIAGTKQNWGCEAMVGQEFEVLVDARYSAADKKHTRMDVTIWKPSGASFSANDDELWPYTAPGTTIHFRIAGVAGEAFDINEAGIWRAELKYVWVS